MIYSNLVASIFDNLLLVSGMYYLIVFFSYKIKDAGNWFASNTGQIGAKYMLLPLH